MCVIVPLSRIILNFVFNKLKLNLTKSDKIIFFFILGNFFLIVLTALVLKSIP